MEQIGEDASSNPMLPEYASPSSFTANIDMHDDLSNQRTNNTRHSLLSKMAPTHLFTPVVLSILVTETAERFSYFGFRALLVLYFTNDLFLDENTAISAFAYTTCLANFSPLLGAMVAERAGRFRTILGFGCLYAIGLMILTHAAFLQDDIQGDPYRANGVGESLRTLFWKRALTCVGLALVCMGTGGIKPVVNIFGADQVALRDRSTTADESNTYPTHRASEEEEIIGRTATTQTSLEVLSTQDGDDHAVREFFNFFYFCINLGAVTSFAVIPIVKVHFGFGVAFLLPTLFMVFALCLFYSKRNQYIHRDQHDDRAQHEGSKLATTFRICFQLIRQRIGSNLPRTWRNPHNHQLISQRDDAEPQQEQIHGLVARTRIDVSQDIFQSEPGQSSSDVNTTTSWAQNQVELEDARQALQILPIMAMLPIFWMLYDQQGSVWTLQASRMALHGLEPEQLNMLNPLEIMIFIPLFDRVIYPAMEERKWNIPPLRRMGWGMVLAALSFIMSGVLEQAIELSPMGAVNVMWQVPQITILAVGEIFLSVTGLEVSTRQDDTR
jgi:dipeptide/tripeptide permease